MNASDILTQEFRGFCFQNQLPLMPADELIFVEGLEPEQIEFIQDFMVSWSVNCEGDYPV